MAAPNLSSVDDRLWNLYNFDPNLPAAIFGIVSYAVVAFVHVGRFSQTWPWHFWVMNIGIIAECIGLGTRVASIKQPWEEQVYFTSYIALLLAPPLMAIACYSTFNRIMRWATPPERFPIRFLGCSIRSAAFLSFLIIFLGFVFTATGAGLLATTYPNQFGFYYVYKQLQGLDILKAGLIIQLLGLIALISLIMLFLFVSRHWVGSPQSPAADMRAEWRPLCWAVITAIILVTISVVYRIAELYSSVGSTLGYLVLYEWPFWVFDTIPILGASIVLAIIYPGQILPYALLGLYIKERAHYDDDDEDDDFV